MVMVEYHIDVMEPSTAGARPSAESLLAHLQGAGSDGWELVSVNFDTELERFGRSHVLVFKRVRDAD